MSAPLGIRLDAVEATLLDLVQQVEPASHGGRGRPAVLPTAWLWTAMLVCILRGDQSIRSTWRLLTVQGLGEFGRIGLTADAIYKRLYRGSASVMAGLFHDTREIVAAEATVIGERSRYPHVIAIDGSTLDRVARRLPWLRGVPADDDALLPGKLLAAFDIERQCFWNVQITDLPRQNEKVPAPSLLSTIPTGSLILADLGFFSFAWFDRLTDQGYAYISKLRAKTSTIPAQVLVDQPRVRDSLVWLGAYRADQAKHLVRLIEVEHQGEWIRFITNERDPDRLSVQEAVAFYARRWDIELAFKLVKRDLGLHLLWSAKWEVLLAQVWGVLLIAQVAFHLRGEVARRAEVDLCDVSLALLAREMPRLMAAGETDPIGLIVARRDYGGFIRPSRRTTYTIPPLPAASRPPPDLVTTREPRYAGRRCGPDGTNALHQ
jgi:hypothetical protein